MRQISLPGNSGLVVGQSSDQYRLELGSNQISINGDGLVSSDAEAGVIPPVSIHHLSMVGDFDVAVMSGENIGFCFEAVQFSGTIRIRVGPGSALTFVSCAFDKDAKIVLLGGPCELTFASCIFGESSTIDCSQIELVERPEILDCYEEADAGFILGEIETPETNWKGPLIALAVAGAVSGVVAAGKKMAKTRKQNQRVEHEQVK